MGRSRPRDSITTPSDRPGWTGSVAILAAAIAILLHAALFTDRGLVPADGVLRALPWAAQFHAPPSNYVLADQYTAFVPVRQFFADEMRRGRFPLWNPHLAAGMPSLAGMQVALLYPINLLFDGLGPFKASGIEAFFKLFLAGVFTMIYLRRLGASPAAGLVAGLVYSLSGFMIVWLGHPQVNAAVLLPLLLYFVDGLTADPSRRRPAIGFACAYGCMLLGGHLPTAVHITGFVLAYFAFRLIERGRGHRLSLVISLAVALAAGVLIAAPQLLPYLEYYRESSSPLATASMNRWASHLQPTTLAHFLLPFLSGAPHLGFESLAASLGLGDIGNFSERMGYAGVLTLFLGLVALGRARTRVVIFYATLAFASALVIYGVPPMASVIRALPIVSGINHQRLLLLLDLSAAVLAGLGLDALLRSDPRRRPRQLALVFAGSLVVVLALVWVLTGDGLSRLDEGSRAFLMRNAWPIAAGVAAAFVLTLRAASARAIAVVAIATVAADLLWFAWGFNPAIPPDRYYPPTGATRALETDTSHYRVLGLSTVLPPNTAAVFGIDDARGLDFTTLKRYEELITGRAGDFTFFSTTDRLPPSFPLLNVKYLLAPQQLAQDPDGFELVYNGEIAIYRFRAAVERALVVFDHEVVPDPAALLARVRSGTFDPSKTILFETAPALANVSAGSPATPTAAQVVTYEPDRVVIEASLPRPGFLLLLDNFYPGWTATMGGQKLPILRANYTFRAVALPAGRSVVEFAYRPASFRIGVWLMSFTLLAALVVGVRDVR